MSESEPKLTKNEIIKAENPSLAGNIGVTLHNPEAEMFDADDQQFLKFHGIYQQDDRDVRKQGKHFMFMIRGVNPGGLMTPDLYLTYDRLADECGNQTLRITSRQSFQFHGVVKSGLGALMKGINDALATTLAACGDVNRNVMAPPTPARSGCATRVQKDCDRVAQALLPQTAAYHQIWVEGVKLKLDFVVSESDACHQVLAALYSSIAASTISVMVRPSAFANAIKPALVSGAPHSRARR